MSVPIYDPARLAELTSGLLNGGHAPAQAQHIAAAVVASERPPTVSYLDRLDERAAQAAQEQAAWREAAVASILDRCDPDRALRAAVERTGQAWRELRDQQELKRAELARERSARPVTNDGVVENLRRINELTLVLEELGPACTEAELAHAAARQPLETAFRALAHHSAQQAAQRPKEIRLQAEAAAAAAETTAGRWRGLVRFMEQGKIEI